MKIFTKLLLVISHWFLIAPAVFAQTAWQKGIWFGARCGGKPIQAGEGPVGPCDLCDAIIVIQNIIQMLVELAILITTAMIAWGTFVFMTASGSEERVKKGKKTMLSAIIGLVIVLGAWIIINTLLHILAGDDKFFPWHTINC